MKYYFSTIDIDYKYVALDNVSRIYTIPKNLKCFKFKQDNYVNKGKICIELKCDSIKVESSSDLYNGHHNQFYMILEDFNKYFISERKLKLKSL